MKRNFHGTKKEKGRDTIIRVEFRVLDFGFLVTRFGLARFVFSVV